MKLEVGKGNVNEEIKKRDLPERTFTFAVQVVRLCKVLDKTAWTSRTLSSQLLRLRTSIGANIEEGHAAQSKADFIHKYSISCKEARETLYWLRLLEVAEITNSRNIDQLKTECNELISILITIIKKCRLTKN
ncbi:MAG: four helix bundle protein [Candidatus Anammoxibacter sp.]